MEFTVTNIIEPGSSVSILTRLWAGQPSSCGPIIIRGKEFFCCPKILHRLWDTTGIPFKGQDKLFCLTLQGISLALDSVRR